MTISTSIVLINNMGYLKRRRKSAIIRYSIGTNDDDEQKIRSIMLLFYPFLNEVTEVHNNPNIVEKYTDKKETVDAEQSRFEPNPDFMEFLENINIEDIEDIDEEKQEQFVEEETTTAQELEDFMRKQSKIYDGGQIRLEDKKKLNKRINTLNLEQKKIFD